MIPEEEDVIKKAISTTGIKVMLAKWKHVSECVEKKIILKK